MSMAYSVENRVPFLDNDTAALAWSIPEEYLINPVNKEGKFILKEIAKGYFGHEFAYRKKVGFFIPGNKYRSSNMTFGRNVLASAKKRGIFNTDVLEDWSREKLAIYGGLNHFQSALFLKLFTLEIWCQLFVDRKTVEECKALWGLKSCM